MLRERRCGWCEGADAGAHAQLSHGWRAAAPPGGSRARTGGGQVCYTSMSLVIYEPIRDFYKRQPGPQWRRPRARAPGPGRAEHRPGARLLPAGGAASSASTPAGKRPPARSLAPYAFPPARPLAWQGTTFLR